MIWFRYVLLLLLLLASTVSAQSHITAPKEEFGFNFGDDYQLANYKQISVYCRNGASGNRSSTQSR